MSRRPRGDRILTFVICDGSDVVEEGGLQALEDAAIADNCFAGCRGTEPQFV